VMPLGQEIAVETSMESSLVEFLVGRFDADELRAVVVELPLGTEMSPHLLQSAPTSFKFAEATVELLKQYDQLDAVRTSLIERRPKDQDAISAIWALPRPSAAKLSSSTPTRPALILPQLPLGYVQRTEDTRLRDTLKEERALVGITGLPGSGKTTCAIAAVREIASDTFAAVCWLDAESGTLTGASELRRSVARQLDQREETNVSGDDLARTASARVGDGRLLIVLDEPWGRLDELVQAARCHPRTTVLITLSDSAALYSVGLHQAVHLGGVAPDQGLEVLAFWAGTSPEVLPPIAGELARAIGYHPQGLRLLGANVAGSTDPQKEWGYLNTRLREASLTRVALPGIPDVSLAIVIDEVIARLPGTARTVLDALATAPPGFAIPAQLIATLTGEDPDLCRRTVDAMVRASLVVTTATGGYALSPLAHLWTRDQSGFLDRYSEMVAHLQPVRHELVWAIALDDEALALRIAEQLATEALGVSTDTDGPPLHQAAFHGMSALVKALLDRGIDIHSTDRDGASGLHYAAQAGRAEVAVDLVHQGLSPFQRNDGGKDAVFVAIYHRHADVAEAILDAWPTPPNDVASLDLTLQLAIHRSANSIVRRLLAFGAPHDPDLGPDNSPLLVLAVSHGDPAIVEDLLRAGGTNFRRDTLGEALLIASQNGQESMITSLLALDAPISWRGVAGRTPLLQAAIGGHDHSARLLLEAGSPVDAVDEAGWTAVHLASSQHRPAVVTTLAEFGADLNGLGPSDTRPLTIAVRQATPGVRTQSRLRIDETGARLSQVTIVTDLDPAVLPTVRALLNGGAEIDATDDQGRTALHQAAHLLQPALVSELLTRGANAAIRDNADKMAYNLAQESMGAPSGLLLIRLEAVLKLLEEAAASP
jgi:ankyrin repeat protein